MATASSAFSSDSPHLRDLLNNIHVGDIQLPDFQRGWVWDDDHIRSLLASVSLSFPIGAVMLLETGGNGLNFKARPVEGAPDHDKGPRSLILDGQQRMTSLYLTLKGENAVKTRRRNKDILRRYFLDIEKAIDPLVDREDAIVSVPEDCVIRENFNRDIVLDLSSLENQILANHIPVNVLFDEAKYSEWRRAYWKHQAKQGADEESFELFDTFEAEVRNRFLHYRVPTIELGKDTAREAVCQVFEKVNTGGVVLTVFELMTATYAADNFELRKDWEARRGRLHRHNVLRAVDATTFMQAVTLLASYERTVNDPDKAVSCKRKDMLALSCEVFRGRSAALEEGMVKAAKFLTKLNIFNERNLPYSSQLIPLGAICAALDKRFEEDNVRKKLAQWYWCGVLGEQYGGALDARFSNDIADFMKWIDGGEEPRTVRSANFSPTRLLSLQTRNSAAYKGIMALLVEKGSQDFINGDDISLTNYFEEKVDIHHIFPKAYCKKQSYSKRFWNSVVNKAPLTARTNRIIGGKAPSDYLAQIIKKGSVDEIRLDQILETHAIDPASMHADDFHAFIQDRAARLLDLIEGAMGKPAQGRDSEETRKAFGGSLQAGGGDLEDDALGEEE